MDIVITVDSSKSVTKLQIYRAEAGLLATSEATAVTDFDVDHRAALDQIERQLGQLLLTAVAFSGRAPELRAMLQGRVEEVMSEATRLLGERSSGTDDPQELLRLGLLKAAQAVSIKSENMLNEADSLIQTAAGSGHVDAKRLLEIWPSIKAQYALLCKGR